MDDAVHTKQLENEWKFDFLIDAGIMENEWKFDFLIDAGIMQSSNYLGKRKLKVYVENSSRKLFIQLIPFSGMGFLIIHQDNNVQSVYSQADRSIFPDMCSDLGFSLRFPGWLLCCSVWD